MTEAEKDRTLWLYVRGLSTEAVASALRLSKLDVARCIGCMLIGEEPLPEATHLLGMEETSWTAREDYVLWTMAQSGLPPSKVAGVLMRSVEQLKKRRLVLRSKREKQMEFWNG